MEYEGTEALTGGAAPAPPPPPPPDASAPAPPAIGATMPGANGVPALPQPPAANVAPPPPAPPPSPVARAFGSILDLLVNPQTTTVSRDDTGARVVTPGKPLSRGQQAGQLLAEALQGASTAAMAPPGPGHVWQGVGAATAGGIKDATDAAAHKDAQADADFDAKQKAKMDSINYQLLQRKVASAALDDRLAETRSSQETVNFTNQMMDRERSVLKSYDLGSVKNSSEIAKLITSLPDWEQKLYEEKALLPVPILDASGKQQGLQLFLRRTPDGDQPAPPDTQVPKFVPGGPGEQPKTVYWTPANATRSEIDNYNAKYLNDESSYRMSQANLAHTKAETTEAGARTAEATANAAKARAETRKMQIEAMNEDPAQQGVGGGGGTIQQNAAMMVEGQSSPSLMSKRNKTYDQLLPAANAYSMQKYGVPFDAETSEARYQARKKTIEQFASGTEGDQVQSLNQFFGHAGNLVQQVDQLRNTRSPLINVPLKDLRKAMGDPRYAQVEPLIYAVRKEYQNFLSNNRALHNEDIAEGSGMLNDTQSLAQMEAAIKGFGGAAITRVGALNNRFKRIVGTGDVPGLMDDNTKAAITNLGLGNLASREIGTPYTGQQQQQQQQPQRQAAPQAQPPTHVFSPSAWKAANPTGDVNAAIAAAKAQHYTVTQ